MDIISTGEPDIDSKDNVEFMATFHRRWSDSAEATADIRRDALDDLKFIGGEQWPQEIMRDRQVSFRPCLTINRLPQFVRQVTNDLRQNRPSMTFSPVHEDADEDTAEVMQGLARHIEYISNAEIAYDTATTSAVRCSFGYFKVITEYTDPMSFEQDIKIKRIMNPFCVYFDPFCQEPDYSDASYCIIVEDWAIETYKKKYPNSKMANASMSEYTTIGDTHPQWMSNDMIRIAEYYYIDREQETIIQLNDKSVHIKRTMPKTKNGELELPDHLYVINERETLIPKVKWKKLNALEVLDSTDWLGNWIPVIPVLGEEIDIDGDLKLESCIRHAKDSQKSYNFWVSAEAEMIALAPKSPFIGAAGAFEGFEKDWQMANVTNVPFLQYNPIDVEGKPCPPPQRNAYEAPIQAITNARQQAAEDLKATIGIYDPALGKESNETSGRAILARQNQSHTSTFHFSDNLARAMKHLGRIIAELIPKIYDEPRVVRIIGETGTHKQVKINQPFTEDGVQKLYDLTAGKYDVIISSGPSYNTKRQENAACMQEVISAYPPIMDKAGDLLVKNFDWPGAQELAERLAMFLPAGIADAGDIPPQIKQQMDQQNSMIQQLTQHVGKLTDKLDGKIADIQSKERQTYAKIQGELLKVMATTTSEEAKHAFAMEIKHLGDLMKAQGQDDPGPAAAQEAGAMGGGASAQ